ncbi:hypothetical protein [Saccharothrix lopnurensis]|uniref:Uncharacterized protein n=1 Tax=Saccharothrix lopnurensis TaxID=1670621 RepID=A0ABW1PGJ3_9PSEU
MLAQANLAMLTMARDDSRHAVALGHEALATMGSVRSDRVNHALRQLAREGRKYCDLAVVRRLNSRIRYVLTSNAGS